MQYPSPRAVAATAAVVLLTLAAPAAPDVAATSRPERVAVTKPARFVPGELLVKFRAGVEHAKAATLLAELGLERLGRIDAIAVERLRVATGGDVLETAYALRRRPEVLFAEPNVYRYASRVPDDPYYANYLGFTRDAQRWAFAGDGADPGLDAEAAWDVTVGRTDVTIAVIDSGVAFANHDVDVNLWTNPGETPDNGRDDDGNGFVDDVNGWDFYNSDNDPNPDLGNGQDDDGNGSADDTVSHGTTVATHAAAVGDNGVGMTGSAWNVTVMPLKVFTDDGGAPDSATSGAIVYAADNGADVINLSLGGEEPSDTDREAIEYAISKNVAIVAAAGNSNVPKPEYPASLPGVLAVGAVDNGFSNRDLWQESGSNYNGRAPYSQFGPDAVDVVAPGTIFGYEVVSVAEQSASGGAAGSIVAKAGPGTSYASPVLAGLAALVISRDKDLHGGTRTLSGTAVVEIIENTARALPDDPNDDPDAGPDWANHGLADFNAAVLAVEAGGGPTFGLTSVSPSEGSRKQTLDVTVIGSGLDRAAEVWFGPKVTILDASVDSATQMSVRIKIKKKAALGPRDVEVTADDGTVAVCAGCFTVR